MTEGGSDRSPFRVGEAGAPVSSRWHVGDGVGALSTSLSMSASILASLVRGVKKSAPGEPGPGVGDKVAMLVACFFPRRPVEQ